VTIAPSVLPGTSDSAYSADALAQAVARPAAIQSQPITYIFFNLDEVEFIEAAVARLIPADDRWPGALEVGVTNYIDKQMGGAWGAGERLYRSGPWQAGTPSQGYQLPLTPAELFRTAITAINKELAAKGMPFAAMTPANQDAYLKELETTDRDLSGVPAREFFAHLWEATVEGFFGDPVGRNGHC
jgi:gluconate 2-dehydrogenase gamma chain